MLLRGETRENCEKQLMLKGNVRSNAAQVIAKGSTTNTLKRCPALGAQLANLCEKRTMPNVERAERPNEIENAAYGSSISMISTVTPKEESA